MLVLLAIISSGILIFSSCKKEYSCEQCYCGDGLYVANAGGSRVFESASDSILLVADTVQAATSQIINWQWNVLKGNLHFHDNIGYAVYLNNPARGLYTVELQVTDPCGKSTSDTIVLNIGMGNKLNPPVALAGNDTIAYLPLNSLPLNGRKSHDPDSNIMAYRWSVIAGSPDAQILQPEDAATEILNFSAGIYLVLLEVSDSTGLSDTDTLKIEVAPELLETCDPLDRAQLNVEISMKGKLSIPRGEIAIATSGDLVFFAGGHDNQKDAIARVDFWNIDKNTWGLHELSEARWNATAVANEKFLIIAGGNISVGKNSSRVDIFDLHSRKWSTAELSDARENIIAAVIGDKFFFIGGTRAVGSKLSGTVDIYDANTKTWTSHILPTGIFGGTVTRVGEKLYIAGGSNTEKQVIVYNDADESWTVDWSLFRAKYFHTGVSFSNKIYLAGGMENGKPGCRVEIRDLTTNTSTISNLSGPVYNICSFVINDNLVFVPNGHNDKHFDIYSPSTNFWSVGKIKLPGADQSLWNYTSFVSYNGLYLLAGNNGSLNEIWRVDY